MSYFGKETQTHDTDLTYSKLFLGGGAEQIARNVTKYAQDGYDCKKRIL